MGRKSARALKVVHPQALEGCLFNACRSEGVKSYRGRESAHYWQRCKHAKAVTDYLVNISQYEHATYHTCVATSPIIQMVEWGGGDERKHDGKGAQVTDGFGDNWLVPTF